MRKILMAGMAAVLIAGVAIAGLDVYDTVTVNTIKSIETADGTETNAYVDIAAAKGIGNYIVMIGAGYTNATAYTNTVTLYHCATTNGTYLVVTNGSGSAVSTVCDASVVGVGTGKYESVKIESEVLKRYLKLYTVTAHDKGDVGAVLLFRK